MSASAARTLHGHLDYLFHQGSFAGLSDGELLEHYLSRRPETAEVAFATLVERHGPMVLSVCRAVLRDREDTQDAFQDTFLVLVRRAGSIRKRGSLQSWLFGVARRVAYQVKVQAARRRRLTREVAAREAAVPADSQYDDLRAILVDELERLPEKYRAPVLLCDMDGLTQAEAARRLGCPVGTVGVRLVRARQRLRGQLIRRGNRPVGGLDRRVGRRIEGVGRVAAAARRGGRRCGLVRGRRHDGNGCGVLGESQGRGNHRPVCDPCLVASGCLGHDLDRLRDHSRSG